MSFRSRIRGAVWAAILILGVAGAGSAEEESVVRGYALVGAVNLADRTVRLHGRDYQVTAETVLKDLYGRSTTLDEIRAPKGGQGLLDPGSSDAVVFKAAAEGKVPALKLLRVIESLPH
ncbi:MAG: hypothetical protein O7E50_00835 [Gemmatimonadetes bacterium]|nr:hypothetical protein [Gemmatimonadota bacterium]